LNTDETLTGAGLRRLDHSLAVRAEAAFVAVAGRQLPILYRRNALARRYRLYVDRGGQPRVTVPRRGSLREAERFVRRHLDWLTVQLERVRARRANDLGWRVGTAIQFRGQPTRIELDERGGTRQIKIADENIPFTGAGSAGEIDLRPLVEEHLRSLAGRELPLRVHELAAQHNALVRRVTVRNQRSRWGSCSRRGTISLNWRLVQVPFDVRDYIVVHELMHLREMNHSLRFWAHVAATFPGYEECERWLRNRGRLLL
jgi:predicted metal-dependent hydrolase